MDINNQYQFCPTGKNTWICPKCKAVNAEHFCYQCGTARPGAVSGRVCKCGYVNSPQARFCVQCGSSLDFPGNGGSRQQPQKRTAGKKEILLIAVLLVIAAGIVFMVKSHKNTWQSATCMSPVKCKIFRFLFESAPFFVYFLMVCRLLLVNCARGERCSWFSMMSSLNRLQ